MPNPLNSDLRLFCGHRCRDSMSMGVIIVNRLCTTRLCTCTVYLYGCFVWVSEQTTVISQSTLIDWFISSVDSWLLKTGPIGCPETSVRNYHCTLSTPWSHIGGDSVPWLRWVFAALLPRRPWFGPGSVHVQFVECSILIFIGRRKCRPILVPSKSSDVLELWERWIGKYFYLTERVELQLCPCLTCQ